MLSFKQRESLEDVSTPRWRVGIDKERVAMFVGVALIGGFILGFATARFINRAETVKQEEAKEKGEERARPKTEVLPVMPEQAKVTRILRADTLEVEGLGSVHMIGIETPDGKTPAETYAVHGKNALAFTEKNLLNQEIRLEYDPTFAARGNKDGNGQTVAYVYTRDGALFNAELIKQGYAFVQVNEPFKRSDEFRGYEREAMTVMRGLWGMDNPPSSTIASASTPPSSAGSPSGAATPNKPGRLSPMSPSEIGPNIPATSGASSAAASPSEPMVFVADKMYHKAGCELLDKKRQLMALSQARASGHIACGRCFASTVMRAP
jgi:endonuclease YncB( thermonuclease family)